MLLSALRSHYQAETQQAAAPSVSTGSSYLYSSRGIGFKQGNGGYDVFQIQRGDQLGVIKIGGGHIQFKKMEGITPEQEQAVNEAIQDYQMGRVSPAAVSALTGNPSATPTVGLGAAGSGPTQAGPQTLQKIPNGAVKGPNGN